jgi:hypothetical protein
MRPRRIPTRNAADCRDKYGQVDAVAAVVGPVVTGAVGPIDDVGGRVVMTVRTAVDVGDTGVESDVHAPSSSAAPATLARSTAGLMALDASLRAASAATWAIVRRMGERCDGCVLGRSPHPFWGPVTRSRVPKLVTGHQKSRGVNIWDDRPVSEQWP